MSGSDKSITIPSFSDVTLRGTRCCSSTCLPCRELLALHASPGEACSASDPARSAEALDQEAVPRHVTPMCLPTQSIMACEDRARAHVTSARNVVARCVSAGPSPAEHPPSRRTTQYTVDLVPSLETSQQPDPGRVSVDLPCCR